jgi:ribosome biogenesis protein YTM1
LSLYFVHTHLIKQHTNTSIPDFKRYQLSTLVNRLLDTDKPIPLEFLVNGQFLRTSLDDFLTQNGISAESTLNVEYVKALVPPTHVASYEHDDWVSSVDVLSASSNAAKWAGSAYDGSRQPRIISGSFDSIIRVWDSSANIVATGESHTAPVKAVKFLSPTQVVSSSADRTLRLWNYVDAAQPGQQGTLTPTLELYGHKASVDALDVHAPSSRILSASADHTIGLWSTKKSENPAAPENLLPSASNKRRKLSVNSKPSSQRGPLSLLAKHTAQVSDVTFDLKDHTVAYSTSWDHSLKTWDLTTATCVDSRTTPQALFSVCHLPDSHLIACGTSAKHITLIDPRQSAQTISALTLRGHSNAVVSLSKDPNSGYQFVSGSHDGTCRIWDLRSARNDGSERVGESVFVMPRESDKGGVAGDGVKVFGVQWDAEVGVVSGGEDKQVQINKGQ